MTCSACSAAVEKCQKLEGTIDVNVNLVNNTMTVEYDEQVIDDNKIIELLKNRLWGFYYTDSSKASSSTDKSLKEGN